MIKALYDISMLGISQRDRYKFGISRTAENLLYSLLDVQELSLAASSDFSFNVWLHSRLYLDRSGLSDRLPWLSDSNNAQIRNNIEKLFFNEALFNKLIDSLKKANLVKTGHTLCQLRTKILGFQFRGTPSYRLADIDIYHSIYYQIPEVVKRHKKIKQVLTVHDIIPILYPEFCGMFSKGNKKFFNPEFDLPKILNTISPDTWIACPSEATKHDLCEYLGNRVDCEKVYVIPWAASDLFYLCQDSEKIRTVRQKYRIPEGRYILSLNTLEPRKNIETLIRSFGHLVKQEKISDLSLVLSGRLGWQCDSLLEEVKKDPSLAERIILTGYVADNDLAALYSDAMVFVYPSFYEGFGLPPLEAMQCGTPVITSNTSSLPEVVSEAGLIVDPRDQADLCQRLLQIYQSPELRKDLSRKSLNRAQEFSWKICTTQTMSLYRQALG